MCRGWDRKIQSLRLTCTSWQVLVSKNKTSWVCITVIATRGVICQPDWMKRHPAEYQSTFPSGCSRVGEAPPEEPLWSQPPFQLAVPCWVSKLQRTVRLSTAAPFYSLFPPWSQPIWELNPWNHEPTYTTCSRTRTAITIVKHCWVQSSALQKQNKIRANQTEAHFASPYLSRLLWRVTGNSPASASLNAEITGLHQCIPLAHWFFIRI